MAIMILSKVVFQFPRAGCYSCKFNRTSGFCFHGSGQYYVTSFNFDAVNKNVASIQITVRLNQLVLFKWLWYYFFLW